LTSLVFYVIIRDKEVKPRLLLKYFKENMASIIKNNRRFPRVELRTPVSYQVRGESRIDNTICDNISMGGLGFVSERFIPPTTPLMLEINILSRTLRAVGKVTRTQSLPHSYRNRIGLEFVELGLRDKEFLSEYVSSQQS